MLARFFFLWFEPLVEIAARRRVQASDVWDLPQRYRSQASYEAFAPVFKTNGSIVRAIARCYWHEFATSAALGLGAVCFSVAHPILLFQVLRLAMSESHGSDVVAVTGLIACILAANVLAITLKRHSLRILLLVSTQAIGALETLLFDRAIASGGELSSAKASFLFHEMGKIHHVLTMVHTPWMYAIHLTVNLSVLYYVIGNAFYVSIIAAVVAQCLAVALTTWDASSSHDWLMAKARRIQVISECVKTIQSIKLNAWEPRFLRRIKTLRAREVEASTKHLAVGVATRSILSVLPEVILTCTFAALSLSDQTLPDFDPARVFATVTIINRLQATFTQLISTMKDFARAAVYLRQVETFLREHQEQQQLTRRWQRQGTALSTRPPLIQHPQIVIHVSNAMIARTPEEPLLVNAHLLVRKGELVVLHGKVGAGKSTLLQSLIGEALQLNRRGSIEVKGKIAYCSQDPWLQTLSIRENILFGEPYDHAKYLNVLYACCLLRDLAALPGGDQTVVGPKGLNISGGQKARICLARACYSDADVYLLDAPLPSVDAIVQSDIFSRCIVELLQHKTVVLATHNMEIVTSPFVDQVARVEDHRLVHESHLGRTFAVDPRLSYRPHRAAKALQGPGHRAAASKPRGQPNTTRPTGLELIDFTGTRTETKWQQIADKVAGYARPSELDPELQPGTMAQYVALCGTGWFLVPLCLSAVLARTSLVASDIWLCAWTEANVVTTTTSADGASTVPASTFDRETNVIVYATLIFGAAAMTFYGSVVTTLGCKDAANKLFSGMVRGVLHAPMTFFYERPIGEIVNRFSGDVVRMDSKMQEFVFRNAAAAAGALVPWLVLMVMLPEMIIVLPIVLHLIYRNRHQLTVALEMLRHVLGSLTPCYSSIEESIDGRRVIRAFGWAHVDRFGRAHQEQLDAMLKMQYAQAMFQCWAVIQFVKVDFVLIGVLILAAFRRALEPVVLALALNYIFLMNAQLFIWCDSALALGANFLIVDRIIEYADTAPEEESSAIHAAQYAIAPQWPERGDIAFENASFQYDALHGPVLKHISLRIHHGEKIGLVGSTGAGKSSLTMALFRIHELVSGRIVIDGVDIARVALHTLRSRLAIVPQSPLFFQGSLRSYLDPFDEYDDAELWHAVRTTGLGEVVARMDGKLLSQLHENAENLSQGERQLLCLSRVLLKRARIVVLDEATASIDQPSDERLQRVLQAELADATLLSVAHRLESILQFDRVVVMDDGAIVQCGTVEELVGDANGAFFDLLEGALLKM